MIVLDRDLMQSTAVISPCKLYRYWLRRQFKERGERLANLCHAEPILCGSLGG
jgi:hypothetical protein